MAIQTVSPVNVLLFGNHYLLLEFVASWLRMQSGLSIIGVARTPAKALEIAAQLPSLDVVLADVDMAADSCRAFVKTLKTVQPDCRLVFLSAMPEDRHLELVLESRASALLLKSDLPRTILTAMREVLRGGVWFPEGVRARMIVDSAGVKLAQPRVAV